jgi:regulator of PEP synthase PpsR (kinase-PPPase family)
VLTILVVSDATGETAERMLRAALIQFPQAEVNIVRRKNVRSTEQIRAVVEEAVGFRAMILHTMVAHRARGELLTEARRRGVDSLDLLGPVMDHLATQLRLTPQEKPGLFRQLVEARSREIEAVEYAFRHDDGQNSDELDRAEVVLVGISRTMKTPTMLYLAYRGWFAANVPLVQQLDPPAALLAVPASKVFCLLMSAERLIELRRVRAQREGIPLAGYATVEAIRSELLYATELCRRRGWHTIDATSKSVEEVGREIIALMDRRA